jgi:hypothetical protein
MIRPTLAAILVLATTPALAQDYKETRVLAPGAQPAPAGLDQLGWLAGTWRGQGLGGAPAAETYSSPQAGQIFGTFVQEDGKGGVQFYELVQIVPRGGSLVYRLRHFNADLTGWEDAKAGKAVEFVLVAVEGDAFHFNGLTVRRDGADGLRTAVRIDSRDGKPAREASFSYRRSAP